MLGRSLWAAAGAAAASSLVLLAALTSGVAASPVSGSGSGSDSESGLGFPARNFESDEELFEQFEGDLPWMMVIKDHREDGVKYTGLGFHDWGPRPCWKVLKHEAWDDLWLRMRHWDRYPRCRLQAFDTEWGCQFSDNRNVNWVPRVNFDPVADYGAEHNEVLQPWKKTWPMARVVCR